MVVLGGVIPDEDYDWLKKQGVRDIYGAGSDINKFIELVKTEAHKHK
jgi:methylmalonyl-CoA mutase cobalamin-binding domain/chain